MFSVPGSANCTGSSKRERTSGTVVPQAAPLSHISHYPAVIRGAFGTHFRRNGRLFELPAQIAGPDCIPAGAADPGERYGLAREVAKSQPLFALALME